MRFHRKFLILLLAISILPMMIVGLYDLRTAKELALRLTSRGNDVIVDRFTSQLRQLTQHSAATMRQQKALVELSLKFQALQAERRLAEAPPSSPKVFFDHQYDSGTNLPTGIITSSTHLRKDKDGQTFPMRISLDEQVIRLAPNITPETVKGDIARLTQLTPTYRTIYKDTPDLLYWQYTSLESGVHSSFPGHGGYPSSYDGRKRPWYQNAKKEGRLVWSPPNVDATTRQILLTASMPIRRPNGTIIGVTAIDVQILSVLRQFRERSALSENVQTFLTALQRRESSGGEGIRIIAHRGYLGQSNDWQADLQLDWLESDEPASMKKLIQNLTRGESGLIRMPLGGKDSFWAYTAIDDFGTFLFFVVPFENVTARIIQINNIVETETTRRIRIAGFVSLFMLVIVGGIAILSARTVTAPIGKLAAAARQVAEGDFTTRVEIKSRDEMGELGEAFNQMVPQLEDRINVHHSLAMAMEVQQSLLPSSPPRLTGFDIAGHSVYSDETGGDYYDYVDMSDLGKCRVGIAVGDVSGHGVAAALLMATVRALLRSQMAQPDSLSKQIGHINYHLAKDARGGRFMTLFYIVLDSETREVHWINAGHDAAILYNPSEDHIEELRADDIPLGIKPEWNYQECTRKEGLTGQILLIGTDGIWETRNEAGEMFGKEAVGKILRAHADDCAEDICTAVNDALLAFRGECVQGDDVTMVVVKG